jgi:hypothetical protein
VGYNISTRHLEADATHIFRIALKDATHMDFRFGVR